MPWMKMLGGAMCWPYPISEQSLRAAIEPHSQSVQRSASAPSSLQAATGAAPLLLGEVLQVLPTPLAAIFPGIAFGFLGALGSYLTSSSFVPHPSIIFSQWAFLVLCCRFVVPFGFESGATSITFFSEPVRKALPTHITEIHISKLIGNVLSFGHGSSSRWKIYVIALRDESYKIDALAKTYDALQEARAFTVAVFAGIVAGSINYLLFSAGHWLSWFITTFIVVMLLRILPLKGSLLDPRVYFERLFMPVILKVLVKPATTKEGEKRALEEFKKKKLHKWPHLFAVALFRKIVQWFRLNKGYCLPITPPPPLPSPFFVWLPHAPLPLSPSSLPVLQIHIIQDLSHAHRRQGFLCSRAADAGMTTLTSWSFHSTTMLLLLHVLVRLISS
jgi:hypothetical protein